MNTVIISMISKECSMMKLRCLLSVKLSGTFFTYKNCLLLKNIELTSQLFCSSEFFLWSDQLKVILQKSVPERAEKEESYEQLTQEQIDILYEEPEMVTTNALKAVLGYVPHDDSRICQFYDQATGGCFKGNACRLEHVAPLMGKIDWKNTDNLS